MANIDSIEIKDLSYQTIKDGKSFYITAFAKTDQFEQYEPLFNRIIQSFRFSDPTDTDATNAIENLNTNVTTSTNQEI
ncbi:MAG: hypothetical protein WCB31_08780 [Nitrososphaeraceae archaeon]